MVNLFALLIIKFGIGDLIMLGILMNIYIELSTIPELRTKDYKDFRRTLRESLEEMPTDDE